MSRTRVLALVLFVLIGIIILRLFYLQVISHAEFTEIARQEQQKRLVLPAERGEIFSLDNGTPKKLVLNETVYTVFADPEIIEESDHAEIMETLRSVAGGELRDGAAELLNQKDTRYQILATEITRRQAEMIKKQDFTGIGFQQGSRRVYPEGSLAAQTLGFVNNAGQGQYGVEQALNERLTGKDGLLQSVTDVRNVPLTIGDDNIRREPQDGDDVVLSIDRNIQSFASDALKSGLEKAGATDGSAIVMDPKTGRVLAMANYPTYDPGEYRRVQDGALFANPIVSSPYEPASVIKNFMFATAIDKGVISRSTTYNNTDSVRIDDATINNALKGMTGQRSMQEAFNWSLNTGSVFAAQQLGNGRINKSARDTIYDYFHNRFRLGQPTGIEVAGEASGGIISPDEVQGNAVRYSNITFGQGLDVTMMQVAAGYSAVVNGGEYYQPTVIAGEVEDDVYKETKPRLLQSDVVSDSTSNEMRAMAIEGRKAFFGSVDDKSGYSIGGKTGTSQQIKNGQYVFNETVGSYLGFGGQDQPEYVIMIRVAAPDKKMEGGLHAGPIFTEISNWMIDYLKLQPKG